MHGSVCSNVLSCNFAIARVVMLPPWRTHSGAILIMPGWVFTMCTKLISGQLSLYRLNLRRKSVADCHRSSKV